MRQLLKKNSDSSSLHSNSNASYYKNEKKIYISDFKMPKHIMRLV